MGPDLDPDYRPIRIRNQEKPGSKPLIENMGK